MLADEIAKQHLRLVRIKDSFVSAACPFHKGGNERRPSFWIERNSGRWGCFSCHQGGSGLRTLLVALGISNRTLDQQLRAAEEEAKKQEVIDRARQRAKERSGFEGQSELPDSLLGIYDWAPQDLIDQGFDEQLLHDHDIGYDRNLDRMTFPIRDIRGTLICISGRSVYDVDPKYLVYSGRRTVDGKEVMGELGEWYPDYTNEGIKDHLWRGDRVFPYLSQHPDGQLIVVEGYKAALWLVQHGWTMTVALMGSSMSKGQERLIRRLGVETFIFLDNNEAGQLGARKICQRLGVSTFPVYRCYYPADRDETTQPDDLSEQEIEEVLSTAKRVGGRFYVKLFQHDEKSRFQRPARTPRPRR